MKIILDANSIIHESYFRSVNAQTFLKAAAFLNVKVIIPEIVVDEVLGNFSAKVDNKIGEYIKIHRELGGMVDLKDFDISVSDEVNKYEKWLDTILVEHDVVIAPYPNVSLKELVQESYSNEKPFKDDGKGHKDYIIWKTVLSYMENNDEDEDNYFITNNTADFCLKESENHWIVHPDLANQFQNRKTCPGVYLSIRQCFDEQIAPNLKNITFDNIPELTESKLKDNIQEILESELELYSAFGFQDLPLLSRVTVGVVHGVNTEDFELKKIEDDILIDSHGTVKLEIAGLVDKQNYYDTINHKDPKLHIFEENWNDQNMFVYTTFDTPFWLTLTYSLSAKKITNPTVDLLNEISVDSP